jgi:hypothetical protein
MTDDTATIERDLAAVDTALASGAATHEEPLARELQELALQLSADAPRPEPAFAEQLRTRVEAGFPRAADTALGRADAARARQKAALERLAARRPRAIGGLGRGVLLPIGGVGLPLLLIVGVIFAAGGPGGSGSGDGDSGASSSGGGAVADGGGTEAGGGRAEKAGGETALNGLPIAPDESAVSRDKAAVAPAQPLPRDGGFAPGQRNRKIERSFSLELDVPLDDMARVADQVTAVTNRHGGFVLNSSVNSGEDEGGGDFSLRIPSDRLRPALRDLAELAPVIRQSQEGRDVTREHVTAKDRLQGARAERRSLLRRLENAATDEEAEAIRRRLDLVAGEINGLRSQLRDLRLRTDYAVVTVSLLVDGKHHDEGSGIGGSFGDAMDDAGALLVGFAGVLIRILALALPLGLIALAAWLATRATRRRRRESALA